MHVPKAISGSSSEVVMVSRKSKIIIPKNFKSLSLPNESEQMGLNTTRGKSVRSTALALDSLK